MRKYHTDRSVDVKNLYFLLPFSSVSISSSRPFSPISVSPPITSLLSRLPSCAHSSIFSWLIRATSLNRPRASPLGLVPVSPTSLRTLIWSSPVSHWSIFAAFLVWPRLRGWTCATFYNIGSRSWMMKQSMPANLPSQANIDNASATEFSTPGPARKRPPNCLPSLRTSQSMIIESKLAAGSKICRCQELRPRPRPSARGMTRRRRITTV